MTTVRTAIVIGGGIAGPVTALALRRAGITATVHEAYPATASGVGGIGGTLALAPNGVAALRTVGADRAVTATATPITRSVMAVGRRRIDLPTLSGVPPLHVVHRAELHRALHDQAVAEGVGFAYGKRLVDAEQTESGVTAHFEDGSTATADVLIGADGIRSTVRGLIDPAAPGPRFTGLLGFEAVARHEVDAEPGTMTFAFGRRGYYLYWPEPDGGTRWGANLPYQRPMSLVEARTVPSAQWLATLRGTYGDDDPGRELMATSTADELQVVGALQIMPPVPHWHRGRMVLVGDAAHAPSNSSGQGASLAIESAVQLARCLRDLPDVASAFAAFEGLRRTRVEKVAARAARINHTKAPGPVGRTLMPLLMPLLVRTAMDPEKTIAHEQRYVIDWDAPVTAEPALR
ncbi:2-polyprenyl-6-methoxyphenol hydroxylase-like FAD-dependent oxidoreductase [Micromonospora jinlongensis]|uniref:2-polyprenyl-6-methoxyphenol hydroxylase-like FAD-dependent oxidoreductase n=1 Tax=Micromonospora jinlongensis TaxID=1287877 RepID=A0A7Y9X1R5_9ACTN|nr:FAD-dependent monooxygenase [Micromonospora jinlongensis]NYH42847.1 2-polyprenyl-6-methoxyphenol hydroxylase-like FAD-dependent oxidoreductase [Micromonospora jinlongensis]